VRWFYQDTPDLTTIQFVGSTDNDLKVAMICEASRYGTLHGFGSSSLERDVRQTLGEPTRESIDKSGLSKMISFSKLKTAYAITNGRMAQICITESGSVSYADEYKTETKRP
jgi:hypothetical protein